MTTQMEPMTFQEADERLVRQANRMDELAERHSDLANQVGGLQVDLQDVQYAVEQMSLKQQVQHGLLTVHCHTLYAQCPAPCAQDFQSKIYTVRSPEWEAYQSGNWPTRPNTPEYVPCPRCGGTGEVPTSLGQEIAKVLTGYVRVEDIKAMVDAAVQSALRSCRIEVSSE